MRWIGFGIFGIGCVGGAGGDTIGSVDACLVTDAVVDGRGVDEQVTFDVSGELVAATDVARSAGRCSTGAGTGPTPSSGSPTPTG